MIRTIRGIRLQYLLFALLATACNHGGQPIPTTEIPSLTGEIVIENARIEIESLRLRVLLTPSELARLQTQAAAGN